MLICNRTLDVSSWNGTNKLLLFWPYKDILESYSNFTAMFSGFLKASTAHRNQRRKRCLIFAEEG